MAVLDWYSRYLVTWTLSYTLDTDFCLEALEAALSQSTPVIFNTDQGAQFTSHEWAQRLKRAGVLISMDGRGRALDNRTQGVVTESLDRLRVTRIVVAHRLSTVANADRIDVLDGGRIVESGSYAQLMQAQGRFARLAARQLTE
jgi:transposase InsO family protein